MSLGTPGQESRPGDFEGAPLTQMDHSKLLDLTQYNGSSITVAGLTWTERGIKDMSRGYQNSPDSNPVLSKSRKQQNDNVIHGGGVFWSNDDMDCKAIGQWIA